MRKDKSLDEELQQHSSIVQDYVKHIYLLQQDQGVATTVALAERLQKEPPSITAMLKKLADLHLIEYTRYQGARLTPLGEQIALAVIRHHRLIELYLVEALGYRWDEVHEEAERLEHALSSALADRIAAALGNPTVDPHGDPIPSREGIISSTGSASSLSNVAAGERARVQRVLNQHPELLRYLSQIGLIPGAEVEVLEHAPLSGPLTVGIDGSIHAIDRRVAESILVEQIS